MTILFLIQVERIMTGRYLVNKPVPPADKSRFNALESNISQKLDSRPRSDALNFEILRTF